MSGLETGTCLCGICGWQLFWYRSDENIAFFSGIFDWDISTILVGLIIWAGKGDYYQVNDGLPQAGADDPVLTTQFYK